MAVSLWVHCNLWTPCLPSEGFLAQDLFQIFIQGSTLLYYSLKLYDDQWVSPRPPIIQKSTKSSPDTSAAVIPLNIVWSQSLNSRDFVVEPWYQGPADTYARPITSRTQLSIMMFHPILIVSNI